jgi:hypothetical protein
VSLVVRTRLAAEIVVAYAQVRLALRRDSLPGVVSFLRRTAVARRRRPLAGSAFDGPRLARAIVRTLDPLPLDSRCLMRSLVLLRILSHRGVRGELIIAVRPQERDRLDAHAWVEVSGRPLLAPAGPEHGRLLAL